MKRLIYLTLVLAFVQGCGTQAQVLLTNGLNSFGTMLSGAFGTAIAGQVADQLFPSDPPSPPSPTQIELTVDDRR